MKNIKLNIDILNTENTSYPIIIGDGIFSQTVQYLKEHLSASKILIVTNTVVFKLYGERFTAILSQADFSFDFCILDDGEKYKNAAALEKILNKAFENKLARSDAFVAFGGGVTGDITGFAASIYLRGIDFVQIPTTLLAQVDSSVGGKTGINSSFGKNLIGAFYQPKLVLADVKFLNTLPLSEFKTGLAEVVKYGFIEKKCGEAFGDFLSFLDKNKSAVFDLDSEIMPKIVSECCKLKADVVNKDEKENGLRAVLNFGHTIAHSIEKCTNYNIFNHGEAVAIGIRGAFAISKKLNKIDDEYYNFAMNLLDSYGLKYTIPKNIAANKLIDALSYDKKIQNGKVRFVLPVAYGDVEIFDDIERILIEEILNELK
ncbi:MAG: 3-dehydroquinate synthase [Candidatus Gastranaerophilales bacterium]|nr:3-dehydroquinate synthase [Candidatus Gastranaerophilales bacterium]